MSTFTPNKNIQMPASGSFNNAWAAPVNDDWAIIDTCLGGTTQLSVTGVGGNIFLSLTQYQPPNIEITGALTSLTVYHFPSGVGGFWSVFNNTSGAFGVAFTLNPSGGGSGRGVAIPQGQRCFIISDGTNVDLAQTISVDFSQLTGQASTAQIPQAAVTQYQSDLSVAFTQVTGVATAGQIPALPASQTTSGTFANARISQSSVTQWDSSLSIAFTQLTGTAVVGQIPNLPATQLTSGTVANARLPNPGVGPGVIIAADPGTTPSGAPGSIWYYY